MASSPQHSLPKQCGSWADLMGAYRFLSNPRVDPRELQSTHRALVRESCRGHETILCVQDTTPLDFTRRRAMKGLGSIGDGRGRGVLQHGTLAVTGHGRTLGVLDSRWHNRIEPPEGETRRERQARWTEADVWADAARAVGSSPPGCRFVHVGDRHSDCWSFFLACDELDVGFLVRAFHDRLVADDEADRLWGMIERQPVAGTMSVQVRHQRKADGTVIRQRRTTTVSIRFGEVILCAPKNDPRYEGTRRVRAVLVREDDPPEIAREPVEWMLLTSEAVDSLDDAKRIITWYSHRWVIEEWHRVIKEGCGLEDSQLDDAKDVQRLAAIIGVIGARLLQLRDVAEVARVDADTSNENENEDEDEDEDEDSTRSVGHDAKALREMVPEVWVRVVAALAGESDHTALTPKQFWRTLARRGGWIGRKSDGRPGWKTIWQGWFEIAILVEGVRLAAAMPSESCV